MNGKAGGRGPVNKANEANSNTNNITMVSEMPPDSQNHTRGTRTPKRTATFGKRSNSMRRNPNAEVARQGWLHKQASSGVKQWNKRWFVFRSSDTFIEALSDKNSEEFKSRSKLVTNQLEGIYRPKYANFLRAIVQEFRRGSIITATQIVFSFNQSVPSIQEISKTLLTAVAEGGSVNLLNIIPGSISFNGSASTTTIAPTVTTASSGLKIESSLLQATFLIIMSQIFRLFL